MANPRMWRRVMVVQGKNRLKCKQSVSINCWRMLYNAIKPCLLKFHYIMVEVASLGNFQLYLASCTWRELGQRPHLVCYEFPAVLFPSNSGMALISNRLVALDYMAELLPLY